MVEAWTREVAVPPQWRWVPELGGALLEGPVRR